MPAPPCCGRKMSCCCHPVHWKQRTASVGAAKPIVASNKECLASFSELHSNPTVLPIDDNINQRQLGCAPSLPSTKTHVPRRGLQGPIRLLDQNHVHCSTRLGPPPAAQQTHQHARHCRVPARWCWERVPQQSPHTSTAGCASTPRRQLRE